MLSSYGWKSIGAAFISHISPLPFIIMSYPHTDYDYERYILVYVVHPIVVKYQSLINKSVCTRPWRRCHQWAKKISYMLRIPLHNRWAQIMSMTLRYLSLWSVRRVRQRRAPRNFKNHVLQKFRLIIAVRNLRWQIGCRYAHPAITSIVIVKEGHWVRTSYLHCRWTTPPKPVIQPLCRCRCVYIIV